MTRKSLLDEVQIALALLVEHACPRIFIHVSFFFLLLLSLRVFYKKGSASGMWYQSEFYYCCCLSDSIPLLVLTLLYSAYCIMTEVAMWSESLIPMLCFGCCEIHFLYSLMPFLWVSDRKSYFLFFFFRFLYNL